MSEIVVRITFRCDSALLGHLPPPVPARAALPEWLRRMPASAHSDTHGHDVRTLKHCPPFVDAMMHGFVIPLPCDVHVAKGELSWDWTIPQLSVEGHTRSPISFHVPAQLTGSPLHEAARAAVKFNCFWTIELPAGWSLFATHPVNRADLPFRTVTGLVDSDRYHDVGIFFPAIWTDPDFSGTLAKGTPVAQCFPVPREPLELDIAGFTADEAASYTATADAIRAEHGLYRKQFRAHKRSGASEPIAQTLGIEEDEAGAGRSEGLSDGAKSG